MDIMVTQAARHKENSLMGRLLEFPKPIEDELPGFTVCVCSEILADHCPITQRCPIMFGPIIVKFHAFRTFQVAYYDQELPYV